jgi:hypothetical protein
MGPLPGVKHGGRRARKPPSGPARAEWLTRGRTDYLFDTLFQQRRQLVVGCFN